MPELVIVQVPITHPEALALIEEVQAEYVERYGGRDDTPLDSTVFDPPRGAFFLGRLDGRAAVTGAWRRRDDVEAMGTRVAVEIKRMYVAPHARGAGHARRMLAHLEETARRAGAEVSILETGTRQPEAIALYGSSGYVPVSGFGHYKDEPLSRCFGKRLGP